MKKFIFILSILFYIQFSAQTFSEMVGEKVYINKKIVAYSYTKFYEKNGIKTQKSNMPSMKNPYNIYISTNENSSTISGQDGQIDHLISE